MAANGQRLQDLPGTRGAVGGAVWLLDGAGQKPQDAGVWPIKPEGFDSQQMPRWYRYLHCLEPLAGRWKWQGSGAPCAKARRLPNPCSTLSLLNAQRSGESTGTSTPTLSLAPGPRPITAHNALGTSYMTTPSENASLLLSVLLRFGRGGSIALPIRAARVIYSCTTATEKQEQIRRRRESPLRIVSIIIGGIGVIVIITKSTKIGT
ncbi:hypothetical protein HDV63DRAFT_413478 [Trichoderma sp. SZMC 28014]